MEREKDRFGVGFGHLQMACPVVFLVGSGEFMLLHESLSVLLGITTADDPGLRTSLPGQPVEVDSRFQILDDHSRVPETIEVRSRHVIDGVRIGAGVDWKVDFRSDDMEERVIIPCSQCSGLIR